MDPADQRYENLKQQWVDQYVQVTPRHPELARFQGVVGRVVTVNRNGKALIDFQDGAWYDVTASTEFLTVLPVEEGKTRYDARINSAQPFPPRQG